jgi:hypothetical protein
MPNISAYCIRRASTSFAMPSMCCVIISSGPHGPLSTMVLGKLVMMCCIRSIKSARAGALARGLILDFGAAGRFIAPGMSSMIERVWEMEDRWAVGSCFKRPEASLGVKAVSFSGLENNMMIWVVTETEHCSAPPSCYN